MTLREKKLRDAIAEAQRFIMKAMAAATALEGEKYAIASIHFAAAKRASMDLTRSLADLRRPG